MAQSSSFASVVLPALMGVLGLAGVMLGGSALRAIPLGAGTYKNSAVESGAFPKALVDPLGETQMLEHPPHRIASVVLSADEILTQIVEPERIIAVTRFADDPIFSGCVDRVPPHAVRISGGAETILALEPDMVFVAAYTQIETVRFLTSVGIPVVRFGQFGAMEEVLENIRTVGAAVGEEAAAQALMDDVESRMQEVVRRVDGLPRPRVLFYSTDGYTVGPGSLMDEMIHLAGGVNVVRETGLHGNAPISLELAVALEPDVVLMLSWGFDTDGEQVQMLLGHSAWQTVPAVKTKRVYALPSGQVNSVSHHAIEGLEYLAHALHPEAFTS